MANYRVSTDNYDDNNNNNNSDVGNSENQTRINKHMRAYPVFARDV
jgi:hypothetical protein